MKALLVVLPLLLACKERSAPEPPVRDEAAKPVPGDATRATLAEELERLRAEHDLPALAAAAWRDGALIESAAVGLRKTGAAAATRCGTRRRWSCSRANRRIGSRS